MICEIDVDTELINDKRNQDNVIGQCENFIGLYNDQKLQSTIFQYDLNSQKFVKVLKMIK